MAKRLIDLIRHKKWKGFQRYLYKMILSNMIVILIPISILGLIWFEMISHQSEIKFRQQKAIELNEITSGISQRITSLKMELATEVMEKKYSTYTISGEYNTDLAMISRRLSNMNEKYHAVDSFYFYDRKTGKIYNSKSGKYDFELFYDTKWLEEIEDNIYSVQQLPLRYAFNNEELLQKYNTLYGEFNKLVLSLVIKGRPDFFLVTNISINRLYNEIADTYNLNDNSLEFFFLDTNGELIEGNSDDTDAETLIQLPFKALGKNVSYTINNDRIYFMKTLEDQFTCVISYPKLESSLESKYFGKYIVLICIALMGFSLGVSIYMSKRLYQPIDTLYSQIPESATHLNQETVYNEIDMLKQVFTEMNTFNSNAKTKLLQYEELNKAFHFRSFLENSQEKKEFINTHPNLFEANGNCLCEMLIIKLDIRNMELTNEEEMLFRLNLQEVLRTYLQSSMKGILTQVEEDHFVLLYHEKEEESIAQIRTILTDTVQKTTKQNVYFGISQLIHHVDEIIPQYHICKELIFNSYFFQWKNEIITIDQIDKTIDIEELHNNLLNINTSFIRYIVSQNRLGIESLFGELEAKFKTIRNASHVKDAYNRLIVELDHEFHFSKLTETNLLQVLLESKTLIEMIHSSKKLLILVSNQYGNNDVKENNYCESAKNYLNENYMKDMNITDTADSLNISYSYLSKIFRARMGVTLTDYLNNVRIEKSKDYLANTFLTLTEISERVGYNNVQSYQRFFKKYINITPGDYRKLHQSTTRETTN